MKFDLGSGLPSSESKSVEMGQLHVLTNNCERDIERQIIVKCLSEFSRILDTLQEGKKQAWKMDETEDSTE